MLQTIINPALIAFTLLTTTGVLVHDTQLDRAATVALAAPGALALLAAADSKFSDGSHVHVERVHGPKQTTHRIQPRDDDVRYFANKRVSLGGSDAYSLWPSV